MLVATNDLDLLRGGLQCGMSNTETAQGPQHHNSAGTFSMQQLKSALEIEAAMLTAAATNMEVQNAADLMTALELLTEQPMGA